MPSRIPAHWLAIFVVLLALSTLSACGDPDAALPDDTAVADTGPDTDPGDAPTGDADVEGDAPDTDVTPDADDFVDVDPDFIEDDPDCEALEPSICAMPFPSSHYLAPDSARVTGYTLTWGETSLPSTQGGKHVDPADYRRMDGFGVGTPIVTLFRDLDFDRLPDETRIADSLADDAPILLFAVGADGTTLERVPYFAEPDLLASAGAQRALYVRPAVILEPDTRYLVAMRDLAHTDGSPVEPSTAFRVLRDAESEGTPVAARQAHFDDIFGLLEGAGVERTELVLAWDFHTASHEALHGPLVHMRDDALERVGAMGPELTVVEVRPIPDDPAIALEIDLTMDVPHYLVPEAVGDTTAYRLDLGPDGLPRASSMRTVPVLVRVPHSALDGTPHGIFLHAHGLNGSRTQIRTGWMGELANDEHLILVGIDMIGMSDADVPVTIQIVLDLSHFGRLVDRMHQGLVEHLLVMRAMRDRFDTLAEISAENVVVDDNALFFNGISQGGIYGGTVMALATDFTRGHLGVPGANYSLLLPRSRDFTLFFELLDSSYRSAAEQSMLLGVIQSLWDQVDPVSWYRHISVEPLADTPAHEVLLGPAVGDQQVAVLSLEILARSGLEVPLMANYGREVFGITEASYPRQGSGIVSWHFGNAWAEPGGLPPTDPLGDPHQHPRRLAEHNEQMMHFLRTGEIIDVCGGQICAFDSP